MSETTTDFLILLAGIGLMLIIATAVGEALRLKFAPHGDNPTIENLNARIAAWWGMVALMALAMLAGRGGVIVLFAICSFAALREFITLTNRRLADHWAIAAAFFMVLPGQYYFIWTDWYGMYSIFIPVYAFLLMPIIAVLHGDTENFLSRISETQWALMITVYCASHLPALLLLDIPGYVGRNILLIAFLIVVVQLSDVLQYTWGKLVGRHPVAPKLSPSKTWEGLIGGVVSASAIGMLLWWMTPFSPFQALLMSLILTLAGFFGGLVMSAIKRDRGVKDWGHLIAGHGGFIDRLDSVVFAAPFFFHITRYYWSAV